MRRLALVAVVLALLGVGVAVVVALTDDDGDESADPPGPTRTPTTERSPTTAATPEQASIEEARRALAVAREPDDAVALARVIEAAEGILRDPASPDGALESWARVQQAAYRTLAAHPEWDGAVAGAVGEGLPDIVATNVFANRELRALTQPREELPDWVIVAPPPAAELLGHYRAAEAEFGVGWTYLASIHLVESRMGRIRGDSVAGARGPMQFLPSTWEAYGEGDIEDYRDAIRAAGRYLQAHGAPGDMRRALFAYNRSDRYVNAVEAYARLMTEDERAYLAYYHWQVYYRLVSGDVMLEEGWTREHGEPGTGAGAGEGGP